MADKLFRIILQVDDLDKAADFYAKLLADPGRRIPRASRHYIDCGPVILALVDVTAGGEQAKPLPDYVYFAVGDLDQVYSRAVELGCLSNEDVHGASAGEIVVRPWGERSFYVADPWGNGLCFVDDKTLFTGR
jgi:catechol 2,3-dioxygenase-like lactoylglutathione lyase family enzyme